MFVKLAIKLLLQAMDDYEDFEDHLLFEDEFGDDVNRGGVDFFEMSDSTFVNNFRFSKEEVMRLTFLIKDTFVVRERHSPQFQVCLALSMLAGNHFQRIGGLVGGVNQQNTQKILMKVVRAINVVLKDQFLHLPSEEMLVQNARENFRKYKLPDFGWAVDGVHMVFNEKPRHLPHGVPPRAYHNRKLRYSV